MAWKAGSAAALRSQKEQAQKNSPASAGTAQEKTSTSSTRTSGWTKGNAAALRAQKQTEAANADLTSKAFDEYRANNNLEFADEADRQSDWLRGEPSQALRASSPGRGATGESVMVVLDEQSFSRPETTGLRCFNSRLLIQRHLSERSPAAATNEDRARRLAPHRAHADSRACPACQGLPY